MIRTAIRALIIAMIPALVLGWIGCEFCVASARAGAADQTPQATVGVAGRLDGLILPGTELQVAPQEDRRLPVMLRIVETYVHGDAFRYDLEFIGLEPGDFDLKEYLSRKDGTGTESLPSIPIKINSLLPPGHIIPHDLESQLPRINRYRVWVILAATGWVLGLLGLIFWGRRSAIAATEAARPKTFAEMLAPRLAAASSGELSTAQLAELERFVVEFWRRRLGLSQVPVNQAIFQLRQHAEAGPLLRQLENWIHAPARPNPSNAGNQLAELLEPYQKFPASTEEAV